MSPTSCSKCGGPTERRELFVSSYDHCPQCDGPQRQHRAPAAREFRDDDSPTTREEMRRYLFERGWVEDQGHLAPLHPKTGEICFYHMRREEDAMRMQIGRNRGLDNFRAFEAGRPYSWESKRYVG
jgi:hypothetical protein